MKETSPLGTIGSLALQSKYDNDDVLVINADILTNIDFEDFFIAYKDGKSDMAIAAFNVKIDVPYAVLETKDDCITSFVEKPSYIYHSNAGIYLLKRDLINRIPQNQPYDAIDLMSD
jgi:NDP-sugar pyrophosphorylase family protein